MRSLGILHPNSAPVPPDSVTTLVSTAANKVIKADYPSGAAFARVSAQVGCFINYESTKANVPGASMTASTKSTTHQEYLPAGGVREFQIPGSSTGFSVAVPSASGAITFAFWKK